MTTTADVPQADPVGHGHAASLVEGYDVLGGPRLPELESIAALAAQVCSTPMATLGVFTAEQMHHLAAYGIDPLVCRREDSMCDPIMSEPTPVVIPDCREHDRLRSHPFVSGERGDVRFYASHHLVTPSGVTIGTLCVYDVVPRELDPQQVAALGTLAARVVDVLELSLRTRELTVCNDRLTAFAGQVSHDLKTPLASVTLALGMLRDELEPSTDLVSLVDRALRGTARMGALVDEVLDHASTPDDDGRRGPVSLDSLVDDVLDDLAVSMRGVRVVRAPLPTVTASRPRLRALLQNLLENAAKHRHPDRAPVVTVTAVRRPGAWRLCVGDNGRGIPVEERTRVFSPLTRLDPSVPGTGIGLDTCRRVAEEHDGEMGVDDGPEGPGVGVTVWCELPDRPDGPVLRSVPSSR